MNEKKQIKKIRKMRRTKRVRMKILSSKKLPRLTVFRSNKYIYAQIIDDIKGRTLIYASEKELAHSDANRTQKAIELGKSLAKKAIKKKITNVVFDKGAYRYHGRIKALADAAREGGLVF
jgi:large subunit ribosomal protein L18